MARAFQLGWAVLWALLFGVMPALPQAALLPNAKQTFLDNNGKPLTGGKVYLYVPGTTVPKTTWQDAGQTVNNTNPVVLDAAGRAVIYGQGNYQQRLTDSLGNLIWNAPSTAYGSSAPSGANGTDTAPIGTVMPYAGFVLPTNWAWADGSEVSRTDNPDLLAAITISHNTVACTSGSPILGGWPDTSQMRVGAPVEASCVPTGTVISSITNASTIVVSNNAVITGTVIATVFPWGNGNGVDTLNVPDLRGRTLVGPDAMGGTPANRLTVATTMDTVSGSPIVSLASASNIYAGMVVSSANVPIGTTVSYIIGTHATLSVNATATASATPATFYAYAGAQAPAAVGGSASQTLQQTELSHNLGEAVVTDPGHSHSPRVNAANVGNQINPNGNFLANTAGIGSGGIYRTTTDGATAAPTTTNKTGITVAIDNAVSYATTISTTNASPNATVASAAGLFIGMTVVSANVPTGTVISTISGTSITLSTNATATASGTAATFVIAAGGSPHSVMQPSLNIGLIIKIHPNSTGAGGVTSIEGMFGDIICGAGITCENQQISAAGTPFLATGSIYVGNASNIPVSTVMIGDCSIDVTGTITCTKVTDVVQRDDTTNPVTVANNTTILVLARAASGSNTTVNLGATGLRNGRPLQIFDVTGNSGVITINATGPDTIMGLPSWTLNSGGLPGTGASAVLQPLPSDNVWGLR